MADPLPFTAEMAETVREMRLSGASWDAVAARIGMSRWWCIERARLAGVGDPPPRPAAPPPRTGVRGWEPLPPFHPIAAGVLRDAGLPIQPEE